MRRFLLFLILAIGILPITSPSQTYYILGLHRQGNAEDARAYLKIFSVSTNWFTTNVAGSTVPLNLLAGITSNELDAATWTLATNVTVYANNNGEVAVISGLNVGTNVERFIQTNDSRIVYLLNPQNQFGPNVITNNRPVTVVMSNTFEIHPTPPAGGPAQLNFVASTATGGIIEFGGNNYIQVGKLAEVSMGFNTTPQGDGTIILGASKTARRWKNLFLYGCMYISSNSWDIAQIEATSMTYGDTLWCASNGVPTVIWRDGATLTFHTNNLVIF